uniref:Uncharacterized protein n=1 Tax=Arundo donax TaxID=35708 RepID=A0A0A9BCB2_ARUDO
MQSTNITKPRQFLTFHMKS